MQLTKEKENEEIYNQWYSHTNRNPILQKNASIDQPIEDCDKTNSIDIVDRTEKVEKEEGIWERRVGRNGNWRAS